MARHEQLPVKDKSEEHKFISASPFDKNKRKTIPHKHNRYFELIYISRGSGNHYIDSRKYAITPPIIYFIRKEQVHYWEIDSTPEGFVVILKKDFFDKSIDGELKALFMKINRHTCLSVKDNSTIDKLLELIVDENKKDGDTTFHIIEGLLKSLFAKVLGVANPDQYITGIKPGIYQSFIELLSVGTEIKHSVSFYAEKLNTTPQNLNAVCRKEVNQSAANVLSEFIINEAKRLLLYTEQTVSEISFALEFNDPSHFVKYFKKHTGHTPQSFRIVP